MKNSFKYILIFAVLVITALVISSIFLWINSEPSNRTSETTNGLTTIENKIQIDDNRILLTPQNITQYNSPQNPQCDEQFNNDLPNTTIRYSNDNKGIAFDIPYNSNWGSAKFKIDPYWESDDKIEFGDINIFEACTWTRSDFVLLRPQHQADEVIKNILASDPPELIPVLPTVIKIENLTVVKYAISGMCSYPALQIIGKKFNYEFASGCSTDLEQDFKHLENMVKSVKIYEKD